MEVPPNSGMEVSSSDLLDEYRKQLEFQRQQIEMLQSIIKTMAEKDSAKYDLRGAHFSGGFAETVQGDQSGGVQLNQATKL